ncbi:sensor histidine kinase [Paenibacillus sp. HWE-109]|uniref:sensor histidine kinase n=1 Tax=Paenibacillus sp. HWE-109 TaxID=1306526 RepID=UPI001EE0927F|nr:sensor histidine kinase [Paenibacillus sp. HWE-109]UKS30986.1 sensor histidine kinase [Paenibacillus sp. HWE-109]
MKTLLLRLLTMDSRMKLRNKILISFVLMVIIPTVCIGFFSYQKSSSIISEQTSHAYLEALRQTEINMSYRLTEVENISEIVYANGRLQQILRRASQGDLSIGDVIVDYKNIIEIIKNLEKSRNILRIRLMVQGDPLYAMEKENILGISKESLDHWNDELNLQPRSMEWVFSNKTTYPGVANMSTVSLYRTIKDFEDVKSVLALVAIDMDQKTLTNVLQNMNLSLPYQAMLFNESELIASYTREPEQINIDAQALQELLEQDEKDPVAYKNIRVQGKDYLFLVQQVANVNWKLVVLIPTLRITDQSSLLGIYILLLSVSLLAMTVGLSYLLSDRITRRLYKLMVKMKGIEKGHFGELVEVSGQDEISVLQRSFNHMSVQIKTLIDEVYAITLKKQQEEMKVLEGRINSHFLYNTLDTVKWMALDSKAPEIAKIVTNLSKFYRISLNQGHERLSVEKELEHVKAYVHIQDTRFSGNIKFETKIDPALLHKEIIKLILQPIVENAILHGINKSQTKKGTIRIRGHLRRDGIVFTISDDGVGMSKSVKDSLLHPEGSGYGIRNVHERLQLYFGEGSGVKIRSQEGIGTLVRLLLKKSSDSTQ